MVADHTYWIAQTDTFVGDPRFRLSLEYSWRTQHPWPIPPRPYEGASTWTAPDGKRVVRVVVADSERFVRVVDLSDLAR